MMTWFKMMRAFAWLCVCALVHAGAAQAFEIQTVTSPKGITAWLVESHNVPIISMDFSFSTGADADPAGKEGATVLMGGLLTEGAGELSSQAFKSAANTLATGMGFSAGSDYFSGSFSSLSKNRDASLALLKLALQSPRFDQVDFDRVKQQFLQGRRQETLDQGTIGNDAWFAKAFPGHIYGRSNNGTVASVEALTLADMREVYGRVMNREGLRIAVVGDIDAATLAQKLDEVFGDVPKTAFVERTKIATVAPGPIAQTIDYAGPQTQIYFGNPGIIGATSEGWAAYVMAEILGGRATFARLNQVLREKSGLTYGVSFDDFSLRHGAFQVGSFSVANEKASQALALLIEQLDVMAREGPTAEELKRVKAFIIGAYPLRFTTNASISGALLLAQQDGLAPDFVAQRPGKVNAVTLDDVKAVAAKLLKPENRIVVMVGRPK
jgi:zinc protease